MLPSTCYEKVKGPVSKQIQSALSFSFAGMGTDGDKKFSNNIVKYKAQALN